MRLTMFLPFAALALTACASAPALQQPDIMRVVSTTSFGMCVGYCTTELVITEGEAVLTRLPRGGRGVPSTMAPQRSSIPLTASEWVDIARDAEAPANGSWGRRPR